MIKTCVVSFVVLACVAVLGNTGIVSLVNADAKTEPKKLLRHVVLFKFKESATKDQIGHVVEEFAALPKKIDAISDFEMGTDVSVENKSKGFTHGFVVTFRDAQGRKEYLPHPAHKAFVKIVGPILDDVLVFDYYTER
jgi:hypothetical protein